MSEAGHGGTDVPGQAPANDAGIAAPEVAAKSWVEPGVPEIQAPGPDASADDAVPRLTVAELICYSLPWFGSGGLSTLLSTFLSKFYTDVFKIDVGTLGMVSFLVLICHAVSQPVMGSVSDKSQWAFGRRKYYLRLALLPYVVTYFLIFSPPTTWSSDSLVLYLLLSGIVLGWSWGTTECMHQSLAAVICPEYSERTRLAGAVNALYILGVLLASAGPGLFDVADASEMDSGECHTQESTCDDACRDREIQKMRFFGGLFASTTLLGCMLLLFFIKEPKAPPPPPPSDVSPLRKWCACWFTARELQQNRLSNVFLLAYLCYLNAGISISILVPYFVASIIKPPFSVSWYPFTLSVVGMASLGLWVNLSKRWEKASILKLCFVGLSVCFICWIALGEGHWHLCFVLTVIPSIFYGGTILIPSSMMPDIQDYGELLTGQRMEGKYLGYWKIVGRFSAAFTLGVTLQVLDAAGYVEGTDWPCVCSPQQPCRPHRPLRRRRTGGVESMDRATMAVSDPQAANVAAALEQKMAAMQKELQQMQRLKGELKTDQEQFQKNLKGLQKDLEDTTKLLNSAHAKRQKLLRELAVCDEEIKRLEEKKAGVAERIYNASADVEQRKNEKLKSASLMASGNAVGASATASPAANAVPATSAPNPSSTVELLDCLDFNAPPPSTSSAGATSGGAMADLLSLDALSAPSTAPACPAPSLSTQSSPSMSVPTYTGDNLWAGCGGVVPTGSGAPAMGGLPGLGQPASMQQMQGQGAVGFPQGYTGYGSGMAGCGVGLSPMCGNAMAPPPQQPPPPAGPAPMGMQAMPGPGCGGGCAFPPGYGAGPGCGGFPAPSAPRAGPTMTAAATQPAGSADPDFMKLLGM